MGLTETHLSSKELHVPGYNSIRLDRKSDRYGGVIVYIKNGFKYIYRSDLQCDRIESIWIELCLPYKKNILVSYEFRVPEETVDWYDIFEQQLNGAFHTGLKVILLGDFNIDYKADVPKLWRDICLSYNLDQVIREPTRVAETSSTLIDHIYVSSELNVAEQAVSGLSLSDQYSVGVTLAREKLNI